MIVKSGFGIEGEIYNEALKKDEILFSPANGKSAPQGKAVS